jgi:hypothetical protein
MVHAYFGGSTHYGELHVEGNVMSFNGRCRIIITDTWTMQRGLDRAHNCVTCLMCLAASE